MKNKTDKDIQKSKKPEKCDKCDEYLNGWQRTQADFENYKRQTEKRIKDVIEYGNAEMLLEFIPLYNHFKSALSHIPENQKKESWCEGLGHIQNMWKNVFDKFGIQEIETIGKEFDHNIHEAIGFESYEDKNDHEILKEVQSGYTLGGKVIQPAKVIVNKIESEDNRAELDDSEDLE